MRQWIGTYLLTAALTGLNSASPLALKPVQPLTRGGICPKEAFKAESVCRMNA
jgi:hypothetical protein